MRKLRVEARAKRVPYELPDLAVRVNHAGDEHLLQNFRAQARLTLAQSGADTSAAPASSAPSEATEASSAGPVSFASAPSSRRTAPGLIPAAGPALWALRGWGQQKVTFQKLARA